jgi:hypothetical protein
MEITKQLHPGSTARITLAIAAVITALAVPDAQAGDSCASLTAAGYSRGDAQRILRDIERGGVRALSAHGDTLRGPTGAGRRPSDDARALARVHGLAPGVTSG